MPPSSRHRRPHPINNLLQDCWKIDRADRVAYLIDGEAFFSAFREAALRAQRSVFILAWDIHSQFELVRPAPGDGWPTRLGDFLDRLAREKPGLQIHVLNWDYAVLLAPDREWATRFRLDWTTHRRLHFELDGHCPVGGSHHQKVAVIDDRVAFVGGLDFTLGRWDTPRHLPDDPRRVDLPGGSVPQPYHDVQMAVSGPVAAALGELARERWRVATGKRLEPPAPTGGDDPWPASLAPDLTDAAVGIARTEPRLDDQEEVREIEALLLATIAGARRWLYIENQYLTAERIGAALAARLAEEDGPEIVVIGPLATVGWLSQYTMDVLRARLVARLVESDRHGRLRLYYPEAPNQGAECINVHAKVMVADNRLLTVGSANLNNRSMALDTECNLAIDAAEDPRLQAGVARLRDRLLAEHMGTTREKVAEALEDTGSLIAAIERLNVNAHRLLRLRPELSEEIDALAPESELADPDRGIDAEFLASRLVAPEDRRPTRRALIGFASLVVLALVLAASWRWTPLGDWLEIGSLFERLAELRGSWRAPVIVAAVFVIGGLVMIPVTLMIVASGVAFGAIHGFFYALLGAELSALASYAIGHWLGRDTVDRLSHRWLRRANEYLGRQGLLAIITLRIVPVAPYSIINLVAGASRIGLRQFALGTLIGILPGAFALTLLSDQVVAAVRQPDALQIGLSIALGALIAAGAWALSRWLRGRGSRAR